MRKFYILGLFGLAAVIIGLAWAEQITISTYYPAPYGVYKEFKTTSLTSLATENIDADDDARVIIGTGDPKPNKLMIVDGTTETAGGLIIHKISGDDPDNLRPGQMWLRTDINP